jgi:acyl carrier protein
MHHIIERMTGVFREILDDPTIVLAGTTTADDIEEWDSLTHVQIVVSLERHFGIRFTTVELHGYKNVGEMAAGIASKLSAAQG